MSTNTPFIRRKLITALMGHLDHPDITALVGPRQSGKTTILKQLNTKLRAGGRKTLWLNLDFDDDFHHVSSQARFCRKSGWSWAVAEVWFLLTRYSARKMPDCS